MTLLTAKPGQRLYSYRPLTISDGTDRPALEQRNEKQVAALLTNRVPAIQGGAEVLELSAKDTKTLYYMPTGGVRRLTLSTVKDVENVRFFFL